MTMIAQTLGAVCGMAYYLAAYVFRGALFGLPFALGLAGMAACHVDKITHRTKRHYQVTQPNRDHKRANARGKLELVK